ncbi:hypothetical protein K2V14_003754 [Vibrio vulnificus]|nr:hypothetical protein [Vibrio vulnificus]EHY1122762.1 hypothetical protein [Vibrio vulnificus]
MTPSDNGSDDVNNPKRSKLSLLVPPYILFYSTTSLWLTIDGLLSNFSSLTPLWNTTSDISPLITSMMFTMTGSLLGSSILGIISFHRYFAIEKSFDADHIWGFIFAPLLSVIVGALIYAILQSGLFVLSGDMASETDPSSASLGYLAIGGIAGYNWDVFVKKLEELSKNIMNTK